MIGGCGGGGGDADPPVAATPVATPTPAEPPRQAVAVGFKARAGAAEVGCGTPIAALGSSAAAAELQDLRFYVSEAALLTADGGVVPIALEPGDWQNSEVTLIDLEDGTGACAKAGTAATNAEIRGTVPTGTYSGIQFTVGVPAALNHSDYAVATRPMDVQALAWSWQAGRKFLQVEVNPVGGVARPAPAAASETFYVHLGSTGCTGNPVSGETVGCERPDRMAFHAHAFDATTQQIAVDLAGLLATSNLSADAGAAPGCMSASTDPECAPIFEALKIDLATGRPIDDGHGQALFVVESKP